MRHSGSPTSQFFLRLVRGASPIHFAALQGFPELEEQVIMPVPEAIWGRGCVSVLLGRKGKGGG